MADFRFSFVCLFIYFSVCLVAIGLRLDLHSQSHHRCRNTLLARYHDC